MTIDTEKYELASATIHITREESDSSLSFHLLTCNSLFTHLTSLKPGKNEYTPESVFGPKHNELLSFLYDFQVKKNSGNLNLHIIQTNNWLHVRTIPDESGNLCLICFDITDSQKQITSFALQKSGYINYIKNFNGIAFQKLLKPEERYIFSAGAYEEITGYRSEEIQDYRAWSKIIHPEDKKLVEAEAEGLYKDSGYQKELEYRIIRKDSSIGWVHSYDSNLFSEDGSMQMVQGLIVDVTKQKLLELQLKDANRTIKEQNKKLATLALTDPLTGLSNRRSVKQILDFLFDDFKRTGKAFSILMLDLDNFKKVNDNFGHDAGDDVLKGIAKVLKENLRAIDIKARWGGEEFLTVFPHTGEQNALNISQKILSIIRSIVFTFEETGISVTFSGGVCTISGQTSLEELIKKADTALYKAKADGRNRIIMG